jgi:hypothetical protein
MTVLRIITDYLLLHGYDGLWDNNGAEGCGCFLDDIAPCGAINPDCKPGHKVWDEDEYSFIISGRESEEEESDEVET